MSIQLQSVVASSLASHLPRGKRNASIRASYATPFYTADPLIPTTPSPYRLKPMAPSYVPQFEDLLARAAGNERRVYQRGR